MSWKVSISSFSLKKTQSLEFFFCYPSFVIGIIFFTRTHTHTHTSNVWWWSRYSLRLLKWLLCLGPDWTLFPRHKVNVFLLLLLHKMKTSFAIFSKNSYASSCSSFLLKKERRFNSVDAVATVLCQSYLLGKF